MPGTKYDALPAILEELRAIRGDTAKQSLIVARIDERQKAMVETFERHVIECETQKTSNSDEHAEMKTDIATTSNLTNANEKDIDEIKKGKASLWDKLWQIIVLVLGAFVAAWAGARFGGSK